MEDQQFQELKEILRISHSQPQNVTQKMENPIIWISFLGVVLLVLGSLILFVYNQSQESQDSDIQSNTAAIKEMNENVVDVTDIVKDIQNEQEKQGNATQELFTEIKELRQNDNKVLSTRFEAKDFPIHIAPYDNRLRIAEDKLDKREETVKTVEELKDEAVRTDARIKLLESQIQDLRK